MQNDDLTCKWNLVISPMHCCCSVAFLKALQPTVPRAAPSMLQCVFSDTEIVSWPYLKVSTPLAGHQGLVRAFLSHCGHCGHYRQTFHSTCSFTNTNVSQEHSTAVQQQRQQTQSDLALCGNEPASPAECPRSRPSHP